MTLPAVRGMTWRRLADYGAAYGVLIVLAAGIFLAGREMVPPPPSAPNGPSVTAYAPTGRFTCKTGEFYLTSSATGSGAAYFDNATGLLTMAGNFTDFCENPAGGRVTELNLVGEDNCLTYSGPRSGRAPLGLVVKRPCAGKVSQRWSLEPDGLIRSAYTGECLVETAPASLAGCDARQAREMWNPQA